MAFIALALWRFWNTEINSKPGAAISDQSETRSSPQVYQLEFQDCWFKVTWRVETDCAKLITPESDGPHKLPVVIIRSGAAEASRSPLLYLQGGPGASAGLDQQGIEYWLDWIDYAQLERDLVLMDRRGAGLSEPRLECPDYDRFSREVLAQSIDLEQELIQGRVIVEQCYRDLADGAAKFSADEFGTDSSARDILGLLGELEYPEWNLLGVSYGSRLAMAVATSPEAQQKSWVRSLILDSVYPPKRGGIQSWPQVMTQGLQRFFQWCQKSGECRDGLQDLEGDFQRALKALKEKPLALTVRRYDGGAPVKLVVDDHRFVSAVFSAVYQRHRWGDIAPAIKGAVSGEGEALQPLLRPFINQALDEDFSSLAFFAVDCRDHPLGPEADYQQALRDYPDYAHYLELGWRYQACHFLNAGETQRQNVNKLPEDIPALILAGKLDPITPLDWARELHRSWPKSQLAIFPDLGHSVIGTDACAHARFRDFLLEPQTPWKPECLPSQASSSNF